MVVAVFAILITAALTLTSFTFKENRPVVSPNAVELTIGNGESLRVSFVGDSIDAGLYASEKSLGFHGLMVDEWRKSGPVADSAIEDMIGGTARDALRNPQYPEDQQLYVVELGTNDYARVNYREFRTEYNSCSTESIVHLPMRR